MSSTTTTTCSLCRLRFANRPLLELHVREDHPQRGNTAQSPHGSTAGAPASRPAPRSPADGLPGEPADSGTKAGAATTVPRQPHPGWARTGLGRVTGAFRHANAEILLASEFMLHPAGVPKPRQPADQSVEPDTQHDARQAAASGKTDRAA